MRPKSETTTGLWIAMFVAMRTVIAILLLLLLVGSAACHLPSSADPRERSSDRANDPWRRTANGWERNQWQPAPRESLAFSLPHPAILALGEALLASAALLAFMPA